MSPTAPTRFMSAAGRATDASASLIVSFAGAHAPRFPVRSQAAVEDRTRQVRCTVTADVRAISNLFGLGPPGDSCTAAKTIRSPRRRGREALAERATKIAVANGCDRDLP